MFILEAQTGSRAFYVIENKTYSIGRKQCDFLIVDDKSISKRHANITLADNRLVVEDVGSKYNTLLNKLKIEQQKPIELKSGDVIQFGMVTSIFKIKEKTLVALHSGLTSPDKERLTIIMNALKGKLLSKMCPEVTHLTVNRVLLTVKVLHAVMKGIPIVTLNFWEEFLSRVEHELPPPSETDHYPACTDVITKTETYNYNPDRNNLFGNKIFVWKKRSSLEEIIKLAGGKCILYNEENVTRKKLRGKNPEYILVQDEEHDSDSSHPFDKLVGLLIGLKKRPIPQQEIAAAIITCDCEKNCNPDFDRSGQLVAKVPSLQLPSQPLIPETETISDTSFGESIQIPNSNPTISETIVEIKENKDDKLMQKDCSETQETYVEVIDVDEYSQPREGEVVAKANPETINLTEDSFDGIVDDSFTQKREVTNEVTGGIKRQMETDVLPNEAKRSKIDSEKEQTSCGFKTKTLKIKTKDTKLTNFFTSTQLDRSGTSSVFENSVSQISKRKSHIEETATCVPPKRTKLVNNPFAKKKPLSTESKSTDTVNNQSEPSDQRKSNPFGKIILNKQEQHQSDTVDCQETVNTTSVDVNKVVESDWRSTHETPDVKIVRDPNDPMTDFLMSFKDCVVINKMHLISRPENSLRDVTNSVGGINFKKFKKVLPKYSRSTFTTSFKRVVCGETIGEESSYTNDEVNHIH